MRNLPCCHLMITILLRLGALSAASATSDNRAMRQLDRQNYQVNLEDSSSLGPVPTIVLWRHHHLLMRLPLVSALDTLQQHEHLTDIHYQITGTAIVAEAKSNLWTRRRFHWTLFADHLEFYQTAEGTEQVGRSYFFSNGVSGRWDKGQSDGPAWNALLMADRYFSPAVNHANQFEFSIAEPQTLGFGNNARDGSDQDFRPAQMSNLFSPPPLMLAFHRQGDWVSVGIGNAPGQYRYPAFEYSGSRYAGAAWWVDYLGYQKVQPGEVFRSPVAAIHFGTSAKNTLNQYNKWLHNSGYTTNATYPDVPWHHLPIFCGWAEQTAQNVPFDRPANAAATQRNYENWLTQIEQRQLPVGTVIIDDKWQKGYGSFEVDTDKWPDMKGFVAQQHAAGRHVLLWVPVSHVDGLPDALCVHDGEGHCLAPDLGNPDYEVFLRSQIRFLVDQVGIDGFKEDWVWAPTQSGLPVPSELAGMEAVRKFQHILYTEAHRWRPDALVETQTANAAFRDTSDVLRLNDVWYATRDIVNMMTIRADIAHSAGWPLVDTDNASSTTLETWWTYMKAQPDIGIPALYFVSRTETTGEEPEDWNRLRAIWRRYLRRLDKHTGPPLPGSPK